MEKRSEIKQKRYEPLKKGSFTVEAAMVMGLALFAILSVLSGTRVVYNRALLTAHAYECAVTGREKETAGLWGMADEEIAVELEEVKPVSFLRKSQIIIEELR